MSNEFKKRIETCLLSGKMLQNELDEMGTYIFKRTMAKIDLILIKNYFLKKAKDLTVKREVVSNNSLLKMAFTDKNAISHFYNNYITYQNVIGQAVDLITLSEFEIQKELFVFQNQEQLSSENDVWKLYYKKGPNLRYNCYDFTTIKSKSICQEVKYFMLNKLKYSINKRQPILQNIIVGVNYLTQNNANINYFSDITEVDVRKLLAFLETECVTRYKKSPSVASICNIINACKLVIDYLRSLDRDCKMKSPIPYDNVFKSYVFRNKDQMSERTKIIPELVIAQIDKNMNELNEIYRSCYNIFMNTGLRLSEVVHLTSDCLIPSRYKDLMCLRYIQFKTYKSRKRHNLPEYNEMLIPKFLSDDIKNQIKRSEKLRHDAGEPYIFITKKYSNRCNLITGDGFCNAVNRIIRNHNILDENGDIWNITTKQFRKTIAVALIESGATNAELAYWLGHLSQRTSMKYYAEVTKMKLAEMNEEFFNKKFQVLLKKEQISEFSEEQRRLLYIDFKMKHRRVELGFCVKTFADGGCAERNRLINCVGCKNLCTGKKYLRYWEEIKESQQDVIDELELHYITSKITDYKNFKEFKCEKQLLDLYISGVDEILSYSKEGL